MYAPYRLRIALIIFSIGSWYAQPILAQSPVSPDAQLSIAGAVAFTEGPAWHPSGNVYFTDITNNRIMRLDPNGEMHVYRKPSGRSNGLLFDPQLRLLCCEGGGPEGNRRVTRIELNGTVTVLANRFNDKRLNSPNDLTLDSQQRIYFSDPRYGDTSDVEQFDNSGRIIEGVYRVDTDGTISRIIEHEVDRPNGIAVSPGDEYLYVADNVNTGPRAQGGTRKLWRFDLNQNGTVDLSSQRLLFDWGTDRGPDGMTIDAHGRLYVTAGFNFPQPPVETNDRYKAGVYIISPGGELLDFLPIPADMTTNCTIGGPDGKTLFVTSGHKLWQFPLEDP